MWDPVKAAANRAKHRVSFETAVLVFDDPFHASKPDPHADDDRWRTIGLVGSVVLMSFTRCRKPHPGAKI